MCRRMRLQAASIRRCASWREWKAIPQPVDHVAAEDNPFACVAADCKLPHPCELRFDPPLVQGSGLVRKRSSAMLRLEGYAEGEGAAGTDFQARAVFAKRLREATIPFLFARATAMKVLTARRG
jgi:hypothetical protein